MLNLFFLDRRVGFVNKGFARHLSDENGGILSGPVHIDEKGLETKDAEAFWFAYKATVPGCFVLLVAFLRIYFHKEELFKS